MSENVTPRIDLLARTRLGLVTVGELHELGLSRSQIDHRLSTGALICVRRGVYRLPGVAPSWEQCLLAAILASPEGAAASHRSAARIWQLRGIDADGLELTAPTRTRLDGLVIHRAPLPTLDVTRKRTIPVTTLARTLCDLDGTVPTAALGRALDEALRSNETTVTAVERCAARLLQVGGPRKLASIHELIAERSVGAGLGDSGLETKILGWMREAGLPEPAIQYRVKLEGRSYRFDAAYPELGIAIEFHGWHEHGKRSAFEPDLTRRNHIELAGWLLLEFADKHTSQDVIATVEAARARQAAAEPESLRLRKPA
jgi:hypothetical protein